MAFGKAPELKRIKKPTTEDQLWKANVRSEEIAAEGWQTKWGWILNEYKDLHEKMDAVSKESEILKPEGKQKPPETQSLKPYPSSVNREYGWLPEKPEFRLEKFGPDVYKGMPFKDEY